MTNSEYLETIIPKGTEEEVELFLQFEKLGKEMLDEPTVKGNEMEYLLNVARVLNEEISENPIKDPKVLNAVILEKALYLTEIKDISNPNAPFNPLDHEQTK